MKFLLSLSFLFALSLTTYAETNSSEGPERDTDEDAPVCIAEVTYLDGVTLYHKVDCDSEFAGKCLKEVVSGKSTDLVEVSCETGK